jgi:hypothetical protein
MISRIMRICLIKVNIRVENCVPDSHETGVISNVFSMVVDMVGSISSERNKSENTPWEFVSAVSIVSFKNSDKSPLDDSEEMKFRAKDEHTYHGGVVVSKSKLKRMSVLTCDTDWVHEFMMLFVDHLVHWEPFMFTV